MWRGSKAELKSRAGNVKTSYISSATEPKSAAGKKTKIMVNRTRAMKATTDDLANGNRPVYIHTGVDEGQVCRWVWSSGDWECLESPRLKGGRENVSSNDKFDLGHKSDSQEHLAMKNSLVALFICLV